MAKHIHIYVGSVKARDAKQHYDEGSMAATKGIKYDANPYEKGSQEHLDWSKGHNDLRAKRANLDKKLKDANYSKWYNAELAQELKWDAKTYPKGMKVQARLSEPGVWHVKFPDGTLNAMKKSELKFNEKVEDAEGYNARLAKQLPKRVENLIAKIDSLNQLKTKLTSVLRDANALAAKVDKLTDQELSKEFEKIDMGSITGAEKVL